MFINVKSKEAYYIGSIYKKKHYHLQHEDLAIYFENMNVLMKMKLF